MRIDTMTREQLPHLIRLWNQSAKAGEVVLAPLTDAYYRRHFLSDPQYDPRFILAAEENGEVVGVIGGTVLSRFLPGQTHENTPGYVQFFFVDPARRRQGIGSALLTALLARFKAAGKSFAAVDAEQPIGMDWIIPGSPGHDHNKLPGMDVDCPGYAFLLRHGFIDKWHEVGMYMPLNTYVLPEAIRERQRALLAEGVYTGLYDTSLGYDYDLLFDHVGKEFWRDVWRKELALPHPRPLIVATNGGRVVAFTGPVDKQSSGRGWFSGICTDPAYERRGIATVLFHLLMEAFVGVGAAFSTLFTESDNPARRLYERVGFTVVRTFATMEKPL